MTWLIESAEPVRMAAESADTTTSRRPAAIATLTRAPDPRRRSASRPATAVCARAAQAFKRLAVRGERRWQAAGFLLAPQSDPGVCLGRLHGQAPPPLQ